MSFPQMIALITIVLLIFAWFRSGQKKYYNRATTLFKEPDWQLGMQVGISLVVLASSLYVILSQEYDAEDKKWAYGAIGLIVSYWLS